MNWKVFSTISLLFVLIIAPVTAAWADDSDVAHRIVIQVDTTDEATRSLALINADLLETTYGADNVHIVIVAFGPGLGMVTRDSALTKQIESLTKKNVEVDACAITMKMMGEPALASGVEKVPNGVVRIIELQESGYTYFLF